MKLKTERLIRAVTRAGRWVKWHKPEIFGFLGIAGVNATFMISFLNGAKAERASIDAQLEKGGTLTLKEELKATWKYYIPPAVATILTSGFILESMAAGRATTKAVAAAAAAIMAEAKSAKKALKENLGEEGYKEYEHNRLEEKVKEVAKNTDKEWLIDRDANKLIFLEEHHDTFFEATAEEVRLAEYDLNRQFAIIGSCTLNDFYDLLKIKQIPEGKVLGWEQYIGETQYGYRFIDFDHTIINVDLTGNGDFVDVHVIGEPFAPTEDCGPYAEMEGLTNE